MIDFLDVVDGEPDTVYHSHKDYLSSSGARLLLRGTPYGFKYGLDHPEGPKAVFDVGKAAHTMVTGTGEDIVVVDADSWRGKDAKQARDAAYGEGKTPLLVKEFEQVTAMRDALFADDDMKKLIDGCEVRERSYYMDWDGVKTRTRPDLYDSKRLLVVDYKTTADASPEAFKRAYSPKRGYGYAMQAAWYRDTLAAYTGMEHRFCFIVQEKTPPYEAALYWTDPEDLDLAAHLNWVARGVFQHHTETDTWPSYTEQTVRLDQWEQDLIMNLENED